MISVVDGEKWVCKITSRFGAGILKNKLISTKSGMHSKDNAVHLATFHSLPERGSQEFFLPSEPAREPAETEFCLLFLCCQVPFPVPLSFQHRRFSYF
jgi:hypothetical protein